MPYDQGGSYYPSSFRESLTTGLVIIGVLLVILSGPGWISAAVWGWTWFFKGVAVFWLGVCGLTLVVTFLWAIGDDSF